VRSRPDREQKAEALHYDRIQTAIRRAETGCLEAGRALVRADQPGTHVYLLRGGTAYHSREIAAGRRAILDLFFPGDMIGLETIFGARAPGIVIASVAIRYQAIEAAVLGQMMQNSAAVALNIAKLMFESQQRAQALAAQIARRDAPERVAWLLLDVFRRLRQRGLLGESPTFNLHLTQQQIGDHLGLSEVHVNRVLRWLSRERIAVVAHRVVIIKDIDRLEAVARGELPTEHEPVRRTGSQAANLVRTDNSTMDLIKF
jgi:CRP/FNR family transcriptional regulator